MVVLVAAREHKIEKTIACMVDGEMTVQGLLLCAAFLLARSLWLNNVFASCENSCHRCETSRLDILFFHVTSRAGGWGNRVIFCKDEQTLV
jgi:hypothetical protein